jgi:hypothetical protein
MSSWREPIAQLQAAGIGPGAELPGFGKRRRKNFARRSLSNRHAGSSVGASPRRRRAKDLRAHPDAPMSALPGVIDGKEIVRDLISCGHFAPAEITQFRQTPAGRTAIAQGPTKSSVRLYSGIQCDLRS